MGWNADFAGPTIADATDCIDPEESPLWFACTRNDPDVVLIYRADGPALTIAERN